jgi:hypothetical protein
LFISASQRSTGSAGRHIPKRARQAGSAGQFLRLQVGGPVGGAVALQGNRSRAEVDIRRATATL